MRKWMQLVQADLAAIGINTEFDTSDGPTYWGKVGDGDYQIGRSGWIADYPTIDNFLSTALLQHVRPRTSTTTRARPWTTPSQRPAQIADTAERMKASQAVVRLIGDDCPEAPIATYAHQHVASGSGAQSDLQPDELPGLREAAGSPSRWAAAAGTDTSVLLADVRVECER